MKEKVKVYIYNKVFVIYGLSPTYTVTPACSSRNAMIYLSLTIVHYASLTDAPLWIQSEAKGMNKAGYKT